MRIWLVPAALVLLLALGGCPGEKDTISPTIDITAPAGGDTLMPDTVTVTAHATDNKAVALVRFYLDTTELAFDSVGVSGNYEAVWNAVAETLGGTFLLRARAFDSAENSGEDSVLVHIRKTGGGPKYHGGALPADEVWNPTGNPHICTTTVVVDAGHKLTIMPGCTLRFRNGAGITVGQGSGGELLAVGKTDSLIVLMSDNAVPNPGDWPGIGFHASTAPTSRLSQCLLKYGGASNAGAVTVQPGARFSMDACGIEFSAGAGLNCVAEGSPAVFSGNAITSCQSYPIRIRADNLGYIGAGNVLTGNAQDMDVIHVSGAEVQTNATWANHGVPYLLAGDVSIGSPSQSVVTIEPGTIVKFALNTALTVGYNLLPGGLKADATGGPQIVFTTALVPPGRGKWQYIYFDLGAVDSECRLKNCRIQFGGSNLDGEVYLYNANPEIRACAVDSSAGYGIYLDGNAGELPNPDSLRANNTFSGNALGDVFGP